MIELTDERLIQIAPAARELWLEQVTGDVGESHIFSRHFLRRMNALLRRDRRSPQANRVLRVARRVAVVLLFLLLCAGTVLAFDAEVREAVAKWFKETFAHSVVYHFTEEEQETKTLVYTVGWIPEGFELVESEYYEVFGNGHYYFEEIEGAHSINFDYSVMADNTHIDVFNIDDPSQIEEVEINGFHGEYCPANDDPLDYNVLVLFDKEHEMFLLLSSNIPKEDIMHIAREAKLEEFTK